VPAALRIAPVVKPRAAAVNPVAPNNITRKAPALQDPNAPVILYRNLLVGTQVITSIGTGGPLVLSPNTFDRWNFAANTAPVLVDFTFSSDTNIDAVGIGACNFDGAEVGVQYSTTATGGTFIELAPRQINQRNGAMLFVRSSAVTVRRIRVVLWTPIPRAGFVGVIYAGLKLQMPHPIYGGHSPLPLNATTDYFNNRSESGEWIGRQIRRRGFETSVELPRLKPDFYRSQFQPFVDSAKENPFFFAWRPVSYPNEVGYCWTDGDIRASNIGGGRPELSVTLSLKAHG
jgi:hypothetical protein